MTATLTPQEASAFALRLAHLLATGSTDERTRHRIQAELTASYGPEGVLDLALGAIRVAAAGIPATSLIAMLEDLERD